MTSVEKTGVQPLPWSTLGPSIQALHLSITTCTAVHPLQTNMWASLGCSPQAYAASLLLRFRMSRFFTWPFPEQPRSSWARRHRRQCTRQRWRGCRSGRRGWRMARKKGSCRLHHWRCWIALFSRGAIPMIKCSRGECSFFSRNPQKWWFVQH